MNQEFLVGGATPYGVNSKKSRKKIMLLILAMLGIVSLFILVFSLFYKEDSSKLSSSFISSLQASDVDLSYSYLSGSMQSTTNIDLWGQFVSENSRLIQNGEVKLAYESKLSESMDLYTYRITTPNKEIINVELRVDKSIKKIDGVSINRTDL